MYWSYPTMSLEPSTQAGPVRVSIEYNHKKEGQQQQHNNKNTLLNDFLTLRKIYLKLENEMGQFNGEYKKR